ncbi:MAG TPA: 30S ribosomal protein S8 [Acidobacteriota bacterium]|jgi:small subunit ribosomal protein S8|nr:30S ribosomal protein S8 [Acidobacteriota bacterium]
MSLSDPVADYLSRVRNALSAKHDKVDIPASKIKLEITRILKEEGYIQNFKIQEEEKKQGTIRVFLKYSEGNPVITGLKQVSKPGRRIYAHKDKVPKVVGGLGICIVSTSKGIMTGDQSQKTGVGGEVICQVW